MGQYYKAVNLENKEWVYSQDFKCGLKLMEHSYLANSYVQAVEFLLMPNNKWHKTKLVWAGDYADTELDEKGNPILDENGDDINLYCLATDDRLLKPRINMQSDQIVKEYKYIVNHTKKLYVNKDSVKSDDGWKVHPLPLLTCEGNGRGGGDFRNESDLIGSWARDTISIEKERPKGYKKLQFDLTVDW